MVTLVSQLAGVSPEDVLSTLDLATTTPLPEDGVEDSEVLLDDANTTTTAATTTSLPTDDVQEVTDVTSESFNKETATTTDVAAAVLQSTDSVEDSSAATPPLPNVGSEPFSVKTSTAEATTQKTPLDKEGFIRNLMRNWPLGEVIEGEKRISPNPDRVITHMKLYNVVAERFSLPELSDTEKIEIAEMLEKSFGEDSAKLQSFWAKGWHQYLEWSDMPVENISYERFSQLMNTNIDVSISGKNKEKVCEMTNALFFNTLMLERKDSVRVMRKIWALLPSLQGESVTACGSFYIDKLTEAEKDTVPEEKGFFQQKVRESSLTDLQKNKLLADGDYQKSFDTIVETHQQFISSFPGVCANHPFKSKVLENLAKHKEQLEGLMQDIPEELHVYVAYYADKPLAQQKLLDVIRRLQSVDFTPTEIQRILEAITQKEYRKEATVKGSKYVISIPLLDIIHSFTPGQCKELDWQFFIHDIVGYINFIKNGGTKELYTEFSKSFSTLDLRKITFSKKLIANAKQLSREQKARFASLNKNVPSSDTAKPFSKQVSRLIKVALNEEKYNFVKQVLSNSVLASIDVHKLLQQPGTITPAQ